MRYKGTGDGVADDGGAGNGPVGAGFCGGTAFGFRRFAGGLEVLLLGDPVSELVSAAEE